MIRHAASADDPALAPFRYRERQLNTRLHRRGERDDAQFIAEGDLVVGRAIVAGHVPDVILCDPSMLHTLAPHETILATTDIVTADEAVRRQATGLAVALGVVGLFPKNPTLPLLDLIATSNRLVVLSQVDNPTNVGAIVRSAAAFGFTGLVLDQDSSDPFARRALRVAMGTTFTMGISRVTDLADALENLHAAGFATHSLTPSQDATPIDDLPAAHEKIALILGSERHGLSNQVMGASTHKVRIPMASGVDSLNVAAAAAVACYGLTRRNG